MRRPIRSATVPTLALALAVALAGCGPSPSPSEGAGSAPASPARSTEAPPTGTPRSTAEPTPSPEPEPTLGLELPDSTSDMVVEVAVEPRVTANGGSVVFTVTSQAEERIDELVLRWPTELNEALVLRPFAPSDDRLRPGEPLVQPWTKWVIGPGEEGEPEGTISLGWGPLLPGATLTVEVNAVRRSPDPIGFDLQVLAENFLLTLPDGEPAELRVEIP